MKKSVKALLLVLCAVVLVVATVFTTIAYMTSKTDTITNTFSVGNVTITLDEKVIGGEGRTAEDQQYQITPGAQIEKDPTIHVSANSEASFIYAKVVNNTKVGDVTLVTPNIGSEWVLVDGKTDLYYYNGTVEAGKDYVVFATADVSDALTAETSLDETSIVVTAYAIQADGFTDANDAWARGAAAGWDA